MRVKLPPKKFMERLLKSQEGIAGNFYDAIFEQERVVQEQVEWTLFAGRWRWRLHLWYRFGKALKLWFVKTVEPRFWATMRWIEQWTDRQLRTCKKYIDRDPE